MNFISIGGRERPFKFGFNAMDIFCKEYGIGIGAFSETFGKIANGEAPPGVMRDIVYSGLMAGTLSYSETPDYNKYTVGDWLDELGSEGLTKVMKAVTESLLAGGKKKSAAINVPERTEHITFNTLLMQSARAGLKPSEFWEMDFREWSNYMDGVQLKEEDKWRHTRELLAAIYNAAGANRLKGNELIQLPSEKEETVIKPTTLDERLRIAKNYKR